MRNHLLQVMEEMMMMMLKKRKKKNKKEYLIFIKYFELFLFHFDK